MSHRPPPLTTWKKNGLRLVHGQNWFEIASQFHGRRLDIVRVQKVRHQDLYTCEAANSQNVDRPLVYTIDLQV